MIYLFIYLLVGLAVALMVIRDEVEPFYNWKGIIVTILCWLPLGVIGTYKYWKEQIRRR